MKKSSIVQPLFFVSRPERRAEFVLETRILEKDGYRYAEKKAASYKARPHLLRMLDTYNSLLDISGLPSYISVVKPKQTSDNTICFDYIDGMPAERVLLDKVLKKDSQAAYEIVNRLMGLIDSLPSVKCDPNKDSGFTEIFSDVFSGQTECTRVGIIDLNLDNIIIDKNGSWHLFDYEWVFDFPIPKDYLKLRFMRYFLYRFREILSYHARIIESVVINDDIYVPNLLYQEYKSIIDRLNMAVIAESWFQAYVYDQDNKKIAPDSLPPLRIVELNNKTPLAGIEAGIQKRVYTLQTKLDLQQKELDESKKAIQNLTKKNEAANNKLDIITSSTSYRFAKLLSLIAQRVLFWRR